MSSADAITYSEEKLNIAEEFLQQLWPRVFHLGLQLLFALILLVAGSKIISFLRKLLRKYLERTSAEEGLVQFLDALLKYLLYFVLFLMILGRFGVQATSIFALAGSAGLTLGLALQGSLSNFAGGVLILMLKPFVVGDYIVEDTHKNEGTVSKIQLFYTTIVTIDGKKVTIPNATLANTSLTNATGCSARMVSLKVPISYTADIRLAKELMIQVLDADARVQREKGISAFVSELGDSGVLMEARAWVKPEDYFTVMWAALEEIKYRFDENGVTIPYQQLDVHLSQEKEQVNV